jgi:hypothetical protein
MGYWDIRRLGFRGDLGAGICIYIEREADFRRANDILITLGAAVEAPITLPSRRAIFITVLVLTVIALVVALSGR